MAKIKVRKGMPSVVLMKAAFTRHAKSLAAGWDGVMIVTPVNWYQAPARLKVARPARESTQARM
jgi:hypothetical protein